MQVTVAPQSHMLAEQERWAGDGQQWVKWHVISRSFVCRLLIWRRLHENSKSSKTACERHSWLAGEVTERVILLSYWKNKTIINELFSPLVKRLLSGDVNIFRSIRKKKDGGLYLWYCSLRAGCSKFRVLDPRFKARTDSGFRWNHVSSQHFIGLVWELGCPWHSS